MKSNNIYSENWCDLVFENRNQSYGAYQIRKVTNPNTFIAFVGTLLLFGSLIGLPKFAEWLSGGVDIRVVPPDVHVITYIQPPIPEVVLPKKPETKVVTPPPAPVKVEKFTTPIVVEKKDPEKVPTQAELEGKEVGTKTTEGTGTVAPIGKETGTGKELVEVPPPAKPQLFEGWQLSELPSFVGGERPMTEFLLSKTRYPEMEKNEGIEGVVFVSFVVTLEGEIANAEIARKASPGLEREALRVVKLMPKWIPGKHNGKAVNTKMVLPIRFKLF